MTKPDRFYITTPIYYVNDAPHIGHAYTTVNCDAIARWHRLLGDDTFFLTGTDEHGLNVQRSAEANGRTPQEHADITSARYRDTWAALDIRYDDFIRTSEPRHYTAVQALLSKIRDNGHIELDSYEGLYCVSCEDYYTDAQAPDGNCPVHGRALEVLAEENYFFRLSRFEDRLLEYYERASRLRAAPRQAQRSAGFHQAGPAGHLDHAHVDRLGRAGALGREARLLRLVRRARSTTAPPSATAPTTPRFEKCWPVVNHVIGKEILRFHCVWWPAMLMAAGLDPPEHVSCPRPSARGRREDEQDQAHRYRTRDARRRLRRRRLPLPLPARRSTSATTATSRTKAWSSATTPTSPTTSATSAARVAAVVTSKCGGVGPAPQPDSPLAPLAATAVRQHRRGLGGVCAPRRPRRHVATDPRHQRLSRSQRTVESRTGPAKSKRVMGNALEVLRIVCVLASPAIPNAAGELWTPHRSRWVTRGRARARRPRLGWLPRRPARHQGQPPLPPPEVAWLGLTRTAMCRGRRGRLRRTRRVDCVRRGARGGRGAVHHDRHGHGHVAVRHRRGRRESTTCGPRSDCTPTTRTTASTVCPTPATTNAWWRSGSAASTSSTATRRSRRAEGSVRSPDRVGEGTRSRAW